MGGEGTEFNVIVWQVEKSFCDLCLDFRNGVYFNVLLILKVLL